jgi:excisionase family DNA binding protein
MGIDLGRDEVLTTNQIARLLKVHIASVYRWLLSGKLVGYRRGGRFVVRRQDLEAFLEPVVPMRDRPRLVPLKAEKREMDAWTREVLTRAKLL